jgi:hypothetical protein
MRCGWNSSKSMWVTKRSVRKNMSCSKLELNEFKMKDDEGVEQMYSRMGVLIQSINALDVANLSE